ncbi:MAG: HK97 family phage prohead protease [Defluviitaleaceae bacterium]|nr:HK97 family phage prohead protease [Defluviitaleaceae bacterium]MCL2263783.1 HK97 family phage prohead protease [Defluviitaleaceae bacterium]
MRIEIRNDCVILDGYVNAVGRDSSPVITARGKCVEQIEPRAFSRALERATDIALLLNHSNECKLGSIADGNLELFEDNIGLRAIATVTDADVIQKAREKKLRGWSFGMYVNKDEIEQRAKTIPRRHVKELDLFEVSIIDDRMSPCYAGTSIEQRAENEKVTEQRALEFRAVTVDKTKSETPDYSAFEDKIKKYKGAKKP